MAKDYQSKYSTLPETLYHYFLWVIRDYDRMKSLPDLEEGGRNHKAICAIEEARERIPRAYIKGVWDNIQENKPFPKDAKRSDYSRHKALFIDMVARGMGAV